MQEDNNDNFNDNDCHSNCHGDNDSEDNADADAADRNSNEEKVQLPMHKSTRVHKLKLQHSVNQAQC